MRDVVEIPLRLFLSRDKDLVSFVRQRGLDEKTTRIVEESPTKITVEGEVLECFVVED